MATQRLKPNKLHKYSSYSTHFDLYIMKVEDFNNIQDALLSGASDGQDSFGRLAYDFTNKPGRLIANTSGIRSKNQQLRSSSNKYFTKDYHIDNVNILSFISPTGRTGGAKWQTSSMTIFEPYGATFMENLIKAVTDKPIEGHHYLLQPYMLQVSFRGYTADGVSEVVQGTTKYMMLKFTGIQFKITPEGSEYEIEFINYGASDVFGDLTGSLPANIEVNSDNVQQFFNFKESGSLKNEDKMTQVETYLERDRDFGYKRGYLQEIKTTSWTKQWHPVYADTHYTTTRTGNDYRNLPDILNKMEEEAVKKGKEDGSQLLADTYSFVIDDGTPEYKKLLNSEIVKADAKGLNNMAVIKDKARAATFLYTGDNIQPESYTEANPPAAHSNALQISAGTPIINVIKTVIATSTFMTDQITVIPAQTPSRYRQEAFGDKPTPETFQLVETPEKPIWLYKITPMLKLGEWDSGRGCYQRDITYVISLFKSVGRIDNGMGKSTIQEYEKEYNYLYTKQNKDVLDFEMEFNTAALDPRIVGGYKEGLESLVEGHPVEAYRGTTNRTPFDVPYYNTRGKAREGWASGSKTDYRTLMARNFMSKVYDQGVDLLTGSLTIVGDPDFISQDEGFGLSAHSTRYVTEGIDTKSDPIILLRMMTPPDMSKETGIVETHSGGGARGDAISGNTISIFEGYYRILTIETGISNNQFKQVLQIARLKSQDGTPDGTPRESFGDYDEEYYRQQQEDKELADKMLTVEEDKKKGEGKSRGTDLYNDKVALEQGFVDQKIDGPPR